MLVAADKLMIMMVLYCVCGWVVGFRVRRGVNEKDVPCRIRGKGLNFVMVDVEEWVLPSSGLKENQIALSLLGPIGE